MNFGGGQVDITNGKFVFSASEAYMIENGHVTAPLKNCTLIGNGPDALTKVSMVGNDLELDEGVGTCGKDGQSVPGGRWHSHAEAGQHDRGRYRKIMATNTQTVSEVETELRDLAASVVARAMKAGATAAEAVVREGSEFSTVVRMGEVETLKEAGSRAIGLRTFLGQRAASTYSSDFSKDGIQRLISGALELARVTSEDAYAGHSRA